MNTRQGFRRIETDWPQTMQMSRRELQGTPRRRVVPKRRLDVDVKVALCALAVGVPVVLAIWMRWL